MSTLSSFCRIVINGCSRSHIRGRLYQHLPAVNSAALINLESQQLRFRRRSRVKKFTPPIFKKKKPLTPKQVKPVDEELVLQDPLDDVWIAKYYRRKHYDLTDIIDMHRELCMPTMLNNPDALLNMNVIVDMSTKKKTKFLSNFRRTVDIPHSFEDNKENRVVAFCKEPDEISAALKAGAVYAGADEVIQMVLTRELQAEDYEHVVSTIDVMPALAPIRKQLGHAFPNRTKGTFGPDIALLVHKFVLGKTYESVKETESTARIVIPFGRLSMDTEQLIANMDAFVADIQQARSKTLSYEFIKEISITCFPSPEVYWVTDSHIQLPAVTERIESRQEQQQQSVEETPEAAQSVVAS